jgi:hypothetical protein
VGVQEANIMGGKPSVEQNKAWWRRRLLICASLQELVNDRAAGATGLFFGHLKIFIFKLWLSRLSK